MQKRDLNVSPRWAFLGLIAAIAVGIGLFAGGTLSVFAQNTSGACTAPAGGITSCTLNAAIAVAPGGTLTIALTGPTNATITNVTGLPTGCTLTSGAGTTSVTITCTNTTSTSTGIAQNTPLVEQIAVPTGATSVTEIVTYNANGPQSGTAGVTSSSSFTGACTPASSAGTVTCTNNPLTTTVSGGTLTVNVFNTASTPDTVQITSAAPATYGTCTLSSTTPVPTTAGTNTSITYSCAAGQSIPAGTPISVPVAVAGSTFPTTPSETTIANANAPISGVQAVPSSTVTTATFTVATVTPTPVITAITPNSGAAGSIVTITGTGLSGATGITFGNTAGTNIQCNAAGTQCTVVAPNLAAGTSSFVSVTTAGGTSNTVGFSFTSLAALTPSVSAPTTGTVGTPVSFFVTATPSSGATISNLSINFGDGSSPVAVSSGQTVSHTYTAAGPYTVTVTATDTAGASGAGSTTITISAAAPPGVPVTYQPGWNIVAGPSGTVVTGNSGPLYTFQAGNTQYQILSSGTPLVAGQGYWAYFTTATTSSLPIVTPQVATVSIPAGQFVMIGNPTDTTVTISGPADAVDTWDPVANTYRTGVTTLNPGQGAWVFSYSGGTLTLTPH
jgi:PKD repeat protein